MKADGAERPKCRDNNKDGDNSLLTYGHIKLKHWFHMITEVKHGRAWSVPKWVTNWEKKSMFTFTLPDCDISDISSKKKSYALLAGMINLF